MPTKRAIYDVTEFKALPGENGRGRFEAVVAVFGNVDRVGDRIKSGAFTKSLDQWRESGDPIPIIWSHDWGNPSAHIGAATPRDVMEVEDGLKVAGSIDLDNPFAAQVYRLMKERRVKEMSFAYDVIREKEAEDGANELLELSLIEAGPTLKGANPDTELLAVKSSLEDAAAKEKAMDAKNIEAKSGRALSKRNESKLRGALEALQEVLSSIETSDESDEEKLAGEDEASNGKSNADDELLMLKTRLQSLSN